jgi:uncharacterized protein YndB with AHSA1/START domain
VPVGKTKDAGWQIGVSRTLPFPIAAVWSLLASDAGTALWIGPGARLSPERGDGYAADDGTHGETRSFRPHDRIRITYRPAGWDHDSTVQVAVQDRGGRTVLRFHQERLADAGEREAQRRHWRGVIDRIEAHLAQG